MTEFEQKVIERLDRLIELMEPKKKALSEKQTTHNSLVWRMYAEVYKKRWGVEPVRNAKTNAAVANFVKRVGLVESVPVICFFVEHNDPLYIKSQHDLSLALRDAEALRTQWLRGQTVTMKDARDMEHQDHYRKQAKKVMDGKV